MTGQLASSRVARAANSPGASTAADRLLGLKFRTLMSAFLRMSPAMWMVHLYLFFEYVRPQSIYEWMDVAPWSQICILGSVALCLFEGRFNFTATRLWIGIGAFTAAILASCLSAVYPSVSWDNINLWVNWLLLMYVAGAAIRSRTELLLLFVAFGVWNLKMSQHGVQGWLTAGFGFRASGVGGAPGWFRNSGEFGIEMCVFLPLVSYFTIGLWSHLDRMRKVLLIAIAASALISVVASSSRGAVVGTAAIGLWLLLRSPNRLKGSLIVSFVAASIWIALPSESKARFSEMGDDKTSVSRMTYWKDGIKIANEHPAFGIGFKNWIPYYHAFYNPKGEVPHNFLVECVAEIGYVGLICLLGVLWAYFAENARTRRLIGPKSANPDRLLWALAHGLDGAMIGFIVSGSFVTVLFYPYIWMNVAFCSALATVARRQRRIAQVQVAPPSRAPHGRAMSSIPAGRWAAQ